MLPGVTKMTTFRREPRELGWGVRELFDEAKSKLPILGPESLSCGMLHNLSHDITANSTGLVIDEYTLAK